MTPRLCYPTDVPRGALLVDHDLVVADVAVWNDGQLVAVCDREMRTVLLDPAVQVSIDEDTPERQGRLRFARALLARVEEGSLDETPIRGGRRRI